MKEYTRRFSNRVSDYTKYRPDYPATAFEFLQKRYQPTNNSVVADVGSGTGLFTDHLVKHGCQVHAVEPNEPMRAESDKRLSNNPNYQSHPGTAEATTLRDNSVDLVTMAQAFHWFDQTRTATEVSRILKPGGSIALIWNRRDGSTSAFLRDYNELLRTMIPEYSKVNHMNLQDEALLEWIGPGAELHQFPHAQQFDFEGLRGRLMSSSYCPTPDNPIHEPLMQQLEQLHARHASSGLVAFIYETSLYVS